jgi:hypothetical protein
MKNKGRKNLQMLADCDCDPDEFGDGRHTPDCPFAPDITGWLFYPHDGELENGGVYVNPDDAGCIYPLVRGHLVIAERER